MRTLLAFAAIWLVAAEPKPGTTVPKDLKLKAVITGKNSKFTLDLGGKTAEEDAKELDALEKNGQALPKPPGVDLTLVVTNTSDKPVTIWTKGDNTTLELTLVGAGAKNMMPLLAMTTEFRIPEGVVVAAGKTVEFPIKALLSGFRSASKFSYWTKAGEYELIASLKTGISPAPEGVDSNEGFGIVQVTSAAFKITVEEKK